MLSSFSENMQTLEEMAATIVHEIKNPLALALANLDLIKVSDTEEKYKKYCAVIEHELYKINQLVLDFIHVKLSDDYDKTFDLSIMLDEIISEYQRRYETITFIRKLGLYPLHFSGIAQNIRMVFTNILNNAVEAISYKGIVEIIEESSQNTVKITINDNGAGLPQDLLTQPNEYYTSKENGTGVGLHYCRTTIAKYGGRFILQNRPEGGCSAIIELPIKRI